MRSALLAAVLLSGCAMPEPEPPPPPGTCFCARDVCACAHCRGGTAEEKCPCKDLEKPE